MGKKTPKRQHYVPKLYLRNFLPIQNKECIYCFDKEKEISFPANIRDVCQGKYFYDKHEDYFSILESNFNKLLIDIIKQENANILFDPWNRALMALFIANQFLRTKETREKLSSVSQFIDALHENSELDENLEKQLEKSRAEDTKSLHLNLFTFSKLHELSLILVKKRWSFLVNKTEIPFWTSDNPIVRFNPFFDPFGNMGIRSPGVKMYYPLSPKFSLCLLDPKIYSSYDKFKFLKSSYGNLYIEKYVIIDISDILFQNSLQVRQSTRQIFSNINNFSHAEEMIKEEPDLKMINRKRVEINHVNDDILHVEFL